MKKAFLFFISLAAIALSSCETTYSFHYENSGSPNYSYIYSFGSTSFPYSFSYSNPTPSVSTSAFYPNVRAIQDNKATRLYDYILDGHTSEYFGFILQSYGQKPFFVSDNRVYDYDSAFIGQGDAAYVYDITGDGYADFFFVDKYYSSETGSTRYGVTVFDYVHSLYIYEAIEPDRFDYVLNLSDNNLYLNRNKTGQYADSTFGRASMRYTFTNKIEVTWEKRFNITQFNYSIKYGRNGFTDSPSSAGINSNNAVVYADNNSMYVIDIKFSDLGSQASLPDDESYEYDGGIVSLLYSHNYANSFFVNYLGKTSDSYRYYFYFYNTSGTFNLDVSLGGVVKTITFSVGTPGTTTTLYSVFQTAVAGTSTVIRTADYFVRDSNMLRYDMMYSYDLSSSYKSNLTSYLRNTIVYKIDPSFFSIVDDTDYCRGFRIKTNSNKEVTFNCFDDRILVCGSDYYLVRDVIDRSYFGGASSICFDYSLGNVSFVALRNGYHNYSRDSLSDLRMNLRTNNYTNYSIADAVYVFTLPHMTYYLIDSMTFIDESCSRVYTITSSSTLSLMEGD